MKKPEKPDVSAAEEPHPVPMDEELAMFDHPRNVKRLLYGFFGSVGLLLAIDLFYHKYALFPWEGAFGFYAVFGFVACVILVLVAKYILRPLVMRKEDFYE